MRAQHFPLAFSSTLVALLLAPSAVALQASAILREGDAPAGSPAGHTVTSLNNTAVNQVGGFAVEMSTSDGVTTLSSVFGDPTGAGTPTTLRTEGVFGTLTQTSFESFLGMDDAGRIAYSASCDDSATGGTGLDSAWQDDTLFAIEDQPIPSLTGKMWRFASRVGTTGDGQIYWVGGIDDIATGTNEGNGLFLGAGATVLAKTGDLIPPLTDPLSSSAIDFDARVSALGGHWITKVDTDGPTTNDEFVVLDGSVYTVFGGLVGEGELIPAASGGNGVDNWSAFDFFGVTESGSTLMTGDTDGDTSTDEFIAKDGVIVLREGDAIDGQVLTGSIEGAYLNEAGQIGWIWDVVSGTSSLEALGLDDRILLIEGDEVDWDGDGFVDEDHVLLDFTGISALTLGSEPTLYFTADVDVPGVGTLEGFFRMPYPCMKADRWSFVASSGGTQTLELDAGSAHAGEFYGVLGSTSGTTPGFTFKGVNIPVNPDSYFLLTLTQANSPTFQSTFGVLDAAGRATASIVLPADPGLSGLTFHHAFASFTIGPVQLNKVGGPISLVLR